MGVTKMLRKIHSTIRIIAYICSLVGFAILMYVRHAQGGVPDVVGTVGAILIIVGFGAFLVSYAIFMYSKVIR